MVIKHLWKTFELDSFFQNLKLKNSFNLSELIQFLVTDRIFSPKSKLASFENKDKYCMKTNFALQNLYRSLDSLSKIKPELEKHLFDINKKKF